MQPTLQELVSLWNNPAFSGSFSGKQLIIPEVEQSYSKLHAIYFRCQYISIKPVVGKGHKSFFKENFESIQTYTSMDYVFETQKAIQKKTIHGGSRQPEVKCFCCPWNPLSFSQTNFSFYSSAEVDLAFLKSSPYNFTGFALLIGNLQSIYI